MCVQNGVFSKTWLRSDPLIKLPACFQYGYLHSIQVAIHNAAPSEADVDLHLGPGSVYFGDFTGSTLPKILDNHFPIFCFLAELFSFGGSIERRAQASTLRAASRLEQTRRWRLKALAPALWPSRSARRPLRPHERELPVQDCRSFCCQKVHSMFKIPQTLLKGEFPSNLAFAPERAHICGWLLNLLYFVGSRS